MSIYITNKHITETSKSKSFNLHKEDVFDYLSCKLLHYMPHATSMNWIRENLVDSNFHSRTLISDNTFWCLLKDFQKHLAHPCKICRILVIKQSRCKGNTFPMIVNTYKWYKNHAIPTITQYKLYKSRGEKIKQSL